MGTQAHPHNILLKLSFILCPPHSFSMLSVASQLAKVKKLFSELKLVSDNLPVQSLVPMWGQPGNEATSSGKHDWCYKGI